MRELEEEWGMEGKRKKCRNRQEIAVTELEEGTGKERKEEAMEEQAGYSSERTEGRNGE